MNKTLADRLLEAMAEPPRMLFGTLHYADRCNAKTRNGGRCRNAPMQPAGRCRMHGGASPRGEAHPRYKHGKYSKYRVLDIDELLAHWCAQPPPDLSDLFEPLSLDIPAPDLADLC